jgi:hypothetical protein
MAALSYAQAGCGYNYIPQIPFFIARVITFVEIIYRFGGVVIV